MDFNEDAMQDLHYSFLDLLNTSFDLFTQITIPLPPLPPLPPFLSHISFPAFPPPLPPPPNTPQPFPQPDLSSPPSVSQAFINHSITAVTSFWMDPSLDSDVMEVVCKFLNSAFELADRLASPDAPHPFFQIIPWDTIKAFFKQTQARCKLTHGWTKVEKMIEALETTMKDKLGID